MQMELETDYVIRGLSAFGVLVVMRVSQPRNEAEVGMGCRIGR